MVFEHGELSFGVRIIKWMQRQIRRLPVAISMVAFYGITLELVGHRNSRVSNYIVR